MKNRWIVVAVAGLHLALAGDALAHAPWKSEEGELVEVVSTTLESVLYEEQAEVLVVTFRGGRSYEYYGVDAGVYQNLMRAEHKGKYFNAHIRNVYECERITRQASR